MYFLFFFFRSRALFRSVYLHFFFLWENDLLHGITYVKQEMSNLFSLSYWHSPHLVVFHIFDWGSFWLLGKLVPSVAPWDETMSEMGSDWNRSILPQRHLQCGHITQPHLLWPAIGLCRANWQCCSRPINGLMIAQATLDWIGRIGTDAARHLRLLTGQWTVSAILQKDEMYVLLTCAGSTTYSMLIWTVESGGSHE